MKSVILSTVLLSAATAAALQASSTDDMYNVAGVVRNNGAPSPSLDLVQSDAYTFDMFVEHYGKTYKTAEERAAREKTFAKNLAIIRNHNANPAKTFTMNMNHLGDLTRSEFKALMGQIPSTHRDLYTKLGIKDRSAEPPTRLSAIPASIDWRNKSVVTPVKNQGSCGSCWAFASTETMESQWAIATGKLYELSTQQVTECTPNPNECGGSGGCQGATENLAFDYIIKDGGIVTAAEYPYTGTDTGCHVPKEAKRVAFFESIFKVKTNDQEDMLNVLATKGPVTIGVWADPMQFYYGGVFNGCDYASNMNIDHAVQLVGYGTQAGVGDYWIVRNSWGANWGEAGYIRLQRDAVAQCGMDETPQDGSACKNDPKTPVKVCGQCGLLYESSFAVPKV